MEIELSKNGKKYKGLYKALIDDKYAKEVLAYKWTVRIDKKNQYASAKGNSVQLHRMIMELELGRELAPNDEVDHINGDGLDCRVENLRIATHAENTKNKKLRKETLSGVIGISWDKRLGKWLARVSSDYKQVHVGYFEDLEEAKKALAKKAEELHGSFYRPK